MHKIILAIILITKITCCFANESPETPLQPPELAMNNFSKEAKARAEVFDSVAKRYGFIAIDGRFGGEFNNDKLAFKIQEGRTILLLGLKTTSEAGDLQLDQASMGPFLQLSDDWVLAVIQCLKIDRSQGFKSVALEVALKNKTLDRAVLLYDRKSKDVKFLGVSAPNNSLTPHSSGTPNGAP
ncbi:hypothetical protein [Methylotenera sp. N17]|uniref:hypothetical protein n=1 Tax=Methylotenera sp. N17 TaxID=1502761 RepID=UPI00068B69FE|nr:hypothetical protein [Methylotenera sp. N17]